MFATDNHDIPAAPDAAPPWAPVQPRKARKGDRKPRYVIGADGNSLVYLPLKGGATAILEGRDFDRVLCFGVSDQWVFNSSGRGNFYVRASMPGPSGNLLMVARLILDVPRGSVVKYRNGNPLDLRRSNLMLGSGASKQREQAAKVPVDDGTEW